jgi:hypothetical protein
MADFAPNFTARYRVHYTTLGHLHSQLWRVARGVGSTGASLMVSKVGAFYTAMSVGMFTDLVINSAEYAPEDVDLFAPFAAPTFTPGVAVVPLQPISQSTLSTSFIGRSSGGQKARLFQWGLQLSPESASPIPTDNFRLVAGDSPVISGAINVLNAGGPTIVGSDNLPVTWYQYVNTKYNDHWVAAVRS